MEAGTCIHCHRGYPGTNRLDIAHYRLISGRFASFGLAESPLVKRGEQLLTDAACRRCHHSTDQGNRLATNLDRSLLHNSPEALLQAIREPALFMPRFHFSDEQLVALINAILAGAAKQAPRVTEAPQVVHFSELAEATEDSFTKHCGDCHRLLSQQQGGLGRGEMAPNLSGLFSDYYPLNFGEGERWTVENLNKWLENPRKLRPLTQMAPLQLTPEELTRLLEILQERSEVGAQ